MSPQPEIERSPAGTTAVDAETARRARRRFLLVGGAGAVGALAAACGSGTSASAPKPKIKAQQTGNAPTTNSDTPPPTLGPQLATKTQQEADLANLRTATSMEYAIVAGYQALLTQVSTSGGTAFAQAVPIVVAHHQQAIRDLQSFTRSALNDALAGPNRSDFSSLDADKVVYQPGRLKDQNGAADEHGNAWMWSQFIEPTLPSLATATDVIAFAGRMEDIAVATHVVGVGIYSTLGLRRGVGNIAAVEARHSAKMALLQDPAQPGAPNALFFTRDALGSDALLTFDGKPSSSASGG